ncbi:CPBP family intramembrane metalloprotease [Actinomadura sp. KC345]|uniref:CPBP family intramembrane glutamic endopeptidase n=1 Tax=Actinomadura sp. KC345 TaxID=2530371 RepID=UPI001053C1EF|nr:CPBP family intramembrane glutamic endopeptidase [Actinomadura sp. KC345]TDC46505.1 CPBP family intramembrane metalloprotease [Actinomadura sp. KC345]
MSERGEADGWAPLDPDLSGDRPPERRPQDDAPPRPEPGQAQPPEARPEHGRPYAGQSHEDRPYQEQAYQEQAYAAGMPYWQDAPAQPPGWGQQDGAGPYGPQWQDPYGRPYVPYGAQPVKTSWTVASPAGVPFHRMARTDVHRWWRPLLGSLAILGIGMSLAVGLLLVGMIIQVAVTGELPDAAESDTTTIFGNATADLAFNLVALAVFLPVAAFAAWGIQRRRPGTLSSVVGRLRWKWMAACCGLAVLFCIVSFGTSLIAGAGLDEEAGGDEHWVGWGEFLLPAVLIVLLVPFQAAAEEYVFRGWMLQAVGACTLENAKRKAGRALSVVFRTPWPGMVVGSALFTAGHGYTGWGILDIFVFGMIAAWVTVRTGGLEAAIALHVFNNLMAFLISAAVGQLEIVQGSVPWEVVVADIIPMALFALAAVWLARRMRIQTVTSGPGEDDVLVTADTQPARIS